MNVQIAIIEIAIIEIAIIEIATGALQGPAAYSQKKSSLTAAASGTCQSPCLVELKNSQPALRETALHFPRRVHRDYRLAVAFFVDFAATTAFDLDFGAGALPFSGLMTSAFGVIVFGATALAVLAAGLAVTFGVAVALVVVLAVTVFVVVVLAAIGSLVVVGFMALTFPEVFATPDDLVGLVFSLLFGLSELKADAQFWTYLSVAPLLKIVTA